MLDLLGVLAARCETVDDWPKRGGRGSRLRDEEGAGEGGARHTS